MVRSALTSSSFPGISSRPPPAWAKFLVAKFDVDAKLLIDPGAAQLSTAYTPQPPTVVVTPSSRNPPLKGDKYDVLINVTNNDPVPISYALASVETFTKPSASDVTSTATPVQTSKNASFGLIQPGRSAQTTLTFQHTWDWIPRSSPFGKLGWQGIETSFREFVKAQALKGHIGSSLTTNFLAYLAAQDPNSKDSTTAYLRDHLLDFQPVRTAVANLAGSVYSDDGAVTHAESVPVSSNVTINVNSVRQKAYDEFLASKNDADGLLTDALNSTSLLSDLPGFGFDPQQLLTNLLGAVAKYRMASIAYTMAMDPPDADYTTLATATPEVVPELDAMPAGPGKDYASAAFQDLTLRAAQAAAQDKADGAAAAGDTAWEVKQLVSAASFGVQAAAVENQLPALYTLAQPATPATRTPGAAIAYLQANGLPPVVTTVLTRMGWTSDELNGLQQDLISRGILPEEGPALNQALAKADAASALDVSESQLAEAVRLQAQLPGQAVRDLTPQESQDLATARQAALAAITSNASPDDAGAAIQAYVNQVDGLVVATNNLPALQPEIDEATSALGTLQADRTDAGQVGLTALTIDPVTPVTTPTGSTENLATPDSSSPPAMTTTSTTPTTTAATTQVTTIPDQTTTTTAAAIQATTIPSQTTTTTTITSTQVASASPRDQFVSTLYADILHRSPEPGALPYWEGWLDQGATPRRVARSIWRSQEHQAIRLEHGVSGMPLKASLVDAETVGGVGRMRFGHSHPHPSHVAVVRTAKARA